MFINNLPIKFPQAPKGPSATLPGGGTISCEPGQNLNIFPDGGGSCTTPQDTYRPGPILTPPILIPPPGFFPR